MNDSDVEVGEPTIESVELLFSMCGMGWVYNINKLSKTYSLKQLDDSAYVVSGTWYSCITEKMPDGMIKIIVYKNTQCPATPPSGVETPLKLIFDTIKGMMETMITPLVIGRPPWTH